MAAMGCASRFAAMTSRTGSPSGIRVSHSRVQGSSGSSRMTPTTTKGKLVKRSMVSSLGTGRASPTSTSAAPLRSDGTGRCSSSRRASALRMSRIARRYPALMPDPTVERWAASGLMTLTGSVDRPLGPPSGLMERLDQLASSFPGLDAPALLGERAALMGLWRRGSTSCGGSCRLMQSSEGWVAVSLPREEDRDLVPAWLELSSPPTTEPAAWSAVKKAFAERDGSALLERAALLGLPVARVGEMSAPGLMASRLGDAPPLPGPEDLLVVDLSSLWAGPLCGDLLARAGAGRQSGVHLPARRCPARSGFLLRPAQRSQAIGGPRLPRSEPTRAPRSSRPLGRRRDRSEPAPGPRTARHRGGRPGGQRTAPLGLHHRLRTPRRVRTRVGFGDDAAAAGGLVAWSDESPMFCSDAIGDPLTGLTAAARVLQALRDGGRWLLDVAMAGVAASSAGPTLPVPDELVPAPPSARRPVSTAPAFGSDTAAVLAELRNDG